jgi:hypothetical protein
MVARVEEDALPLVAAVTGEERVPQREACSS